MDSMTTETLTPQQMADKVTAAPPDSRDHSSGSTTFPPDETFTSVRRPPHSLRHALRAANGEGATTPTDSTSEEDYDDESKKPVAVLLRRTKEHESRPTKSLPRPGSNLKEEMPSEPSTPVSDISSETGNLDDVAALKNAKVYTVASDDKELRAILKRGMQRASTSHKHLRPEH